MGADRTLGKAERGKRNGSAVRWRWRFDRWHRGWWERVTAALVRIGAISFFTGGGALTERVGGRRGLTGDGPLLVPVNCARSADRAKAQQRREQRLHKGEQDGRRDQIRKPLCLR